ncbi:MAG: hypothetical protein IIZ73_09430, partial [Ruminococcus sp.]|nr:hypothetical protein [Ruminococcus sp.]
MGKIKPSEGSLKTSLMKYFPACIIVMLIGMKLISWLSDFMLQKYEDSHPVIDVVVNNGSVEWLTGS